MYVCPPDGRTAGKPDCYKPRVRDELDDEDLIAWLQDEMQDMLAHELAHDVYGPLLFGEGNFEVHRTRDDGPWLVRRKRNSEWSHWCWPRGNYARYTSEQEECPLCFELQPGLPERKV